MLEVLGILPSTTKAIILIGANKKPRIEIVSMMVLVVEDGVLVGGTRASTLEKQGLQRLWLDSAPGRGHDGHRAQHYP